MAVIAAKNSITMSTRHYFEQTAKIIYCAAGLSERTFIAEKA